MAQHDYSIANQTFPNTRTDLNNVLSAISSNNSGTSAPSTTFANQFWYDTSTNKFYIRNEDNDANIQLFELDQSNDTVEYFLADSIRTTLIEFTDGDDALTIADGGALTTSGNLSIGGSNNELRFYEGANFVGFEAPALTGDQIFVLPSADGTANQSLVTDGAGNLSFATAGQSLRPNVEPLVINGDMAVSQRGTSFTGQTGSAYTLDRMYVRLNGAGTWTISQDTDVPTGNGFGKSLKMDCTTANSSLDAGDFIFLNIRFEKQDMQLIKKGTSSAEIVTVCAWVKSPKTGTHVVGFFDNNSSTTRYCMQTYSISSANTWQKITVNFPADTGGDVMGTDNTHGMNLQFWFAAGSNFTSGSAATVWENYTASNQAVGQVNCSDSTANNIFITGIQMEIGSFTSSTIPDFQFESFGDSLQRCQRYFQTYSQPPLVGIANSSSTFARAKMLLQTQMRASPTATHNGTFNYFVSNSIQPTTTSFSVAYLDKNVVEFDATTNVTSMTAKDPIFLMQSGTASLDLDAEL